MGRSRWLWRFATVCVLLSVAACGTRGAHSPSRGGDSVTDGGGRPGSTSRASGRERSGYKVGNPYQIDGTWYYPRESFDLVETGIASWYGPNFHGKRTANGEIYDQEALTAAHRTLQMPSIVRVTNLENGRQIVVRVNDRGPYSRGRVIDMTRQGAALLGYHNKGTAKVRIEVLRDESVQVAELARNGATAQDQERIVLASAVPGPLLTPSRPPEPVVASPPPVATPVPVVTVPMPPPPPAAAPLPPVTSVPVSRTAIFVQAGAFSQRENATRLSRELRRVGRTTVVPFRMPDGRDFWRVRVGPAGSVEEADALLASVSQAGHPQARIVVE